MSTYCWQDLYLDVLIPALKYDRLAWIVYRQACTLLKDVKVHVTIKPDVEYIKKMFCQFVESYNCAFILYMNLEYSVYLMSNW